MCDSSHQTQPGKFGRHGPPMPVAPIQMGGGRPRRLSHEGQHLLFIALTPKSEQRKIAAATAAAGSSAAGPSGGVTAQPQTLQPARYFGSTQAQPRSGRGERARQQHQQPQQRHIHPALGAMTVPAPPEMVSGMAPGAPGMMQRAPAVAHITRTQAGGGPAALPSDPPAARRAMPWTYGGGLATGGGNGVAPAAASGSWATSVGAMLPQQRPRGKRGGRRRNRGRDGRDGASQRVHVPYLRRLSRSGGDCCGERGARVIIISVLVCI